MNDTPVRMAAGVRGWQAATTRFARRRVQLGLRTLLLMALLPVILYRTDARVLMDSLASFDGRYALAMSGVFLLILLLFAWRWSLIANALGVEADYWDYVRALWLGQAAGELGPALIAGELARFHALRGRAESWRLVVSQAVDRCSGQLVLMLLVLALLPVQDTILGAGGTAFSSLLAYGILLVGAFGLVLALSQRVWPSRSGCGEALRDLFNPFSHPGHYLVSALIQGLLTLNLVLATAGLGLDQALGSVAWLGPLLLLGVAALPGLVSDWGKREAAAVVLLAPAGLAPEQSLAISLIYGGIHGLTALPGLLFLATVRQGRHPRVESSL